jgi:flagellum-specific peptidoglycan hydrolase FlgJ
MAPNDFIKKWKNTAIWNHILYGIPASITIAQSITESGWGEGNLARNANNYFGIKAYTNPDNLPVYYANDDLQHEPFRAYDNPKQSFKDHSKFLLTNPRYKSLFDSTDSYDWAHGLKAAGYGTAPGFDNVLISLIDKYNLKKYDFWGKNIVLISILALIAIALLVYLFALKTKSN